MRLSGTDGLMYRSQREQKFYKKYLIKVLNPVKYSKVESAIVLAKMTLAADSPSYLLPDNFGVSPLTVMVMNYPVLADYLLLKHIEAGLCRVEKFDFKPFSSPTDTTPVLTLVKNYT